MKTGATAIAATPSPTSRRKKWWWKSMADAINDKTHIVFTAPQLAGLVVTIISTAVGLTLWVRQEIKQSTTDAVSAMEARVERTVDRQFAYYVTKEQHQKDLKMQYELILQAVSTTRGVRGD